MNNQMLFKINSLNTFKSKKILIFNTNFWKSEIAFLCNLFDRHFLYTKTIQIDTLFFNLVSYK